MGGGIRRVIGMDYRFTVCVEEAEA